MKKSILLSGSLLAVTLIFVLAMFSAIILIGVFAADVPQASNDVTDNELTELKN